MIIGFTGARTGATEAQLTSIGALLLQYRATAVVHGGAIGADEAFDKLARNRGLPRNVYFSNIPSQRGHFEWNEPGFHLPEAWSGRPPLERNRIIVRNCTLLIAAPDQPEHLRSGTWSTVRYARSLQRAITIVMPDGTIVQDAKRIA